MPVAPPPACARRPTVNGTSDAPRAPDRRSPVTASPMATPAATSPPPVNSMMPARPSRPSAPAPARPRAIGSRSRSDRPPRADLLSRDPNREQSRRLVQRSSHKRRQQIGRAEQLAVQRAEHGRRRPTPRSSATPAATRKPLIASTRSARAATTISSPSPTSPNIIPNIRQYVTATNGVGSTSAVGHRPVRAEQRPERSAAGAGASRSAVAAHAAA